MTTTASAHDGLATVTLADDSLVVTLRPVAVALCLRRRLVVPLSHVVGAHRDPGALVKAGAGARRRRGAAKYVVGPQSGNAGYAFWAWRTGRNAVRVDLRDHRYDHLVVEVDDPQRVVREVRAALHRSDGPSEVTA